MNNPDSPTNRPNGSYLDELMKELQAMTNTYESNHSIKFRYAQNLLIREIQRVLDTEVLINSLDTRTPSSGNRRVMAGRDAEISLVELSSIGNLLKDDFVLKTPSSISGPASLRRRQTFSPLTLSLIGGGSVLKSEKRVDEEGAIEKTDKLFFPPETALNVNPIGRLIGPRGMTIRQLEKDLGCKLFIRGKGCTRDDAKEERLRGRPGWDHLEEPIHVLITVHANTKESAIGKLDSVKSTLQNFLENNDSELKRSQLLQLAVIEGNLK